MRNIPIMKSVVLDTIKKPELVGGVLEKYAKSKMLTQPRVYAMAVCPRCHLVRGKTLILKELVVPCLLFS